MTLRQSDSEVEEMDRFKCREADEGDGGEVSSWAGTSQVADRS